jgi:predicted nucleotidyltransferase
MKLKKEEIVPALQETLSKRPEIVFAYLFGSAVESDSFRDIDVGLYLALDRMAVDPFQYSLRTSVELEQLTGSPVDLVLMNTAPDHLIHRIAKGHLLVDRDEALRINFITTCCSRFFDFEPKRRQWLMELREVL